MPAVLVNTGHCTDLGQLRHLEVLHPTCAEEVTELPCRGGSPGVRRGRGPHGHSDADLLQVPKGLHEAVEQVDGPG